jgi:hypothetical protein
MAGTSPAMIAETAERTRIAASPDIAHGAGL